MSQILKSRKPGLERKRSQNRDPKSSPRNYQVSKCRSRIGSQKDRGLNTWAPPAPARTSPSPSRRHTRGLSCLLCVLSLLLRIGVEIFSRGPNHAADKCRRKSPAMLGGAAGRRKLGEDKS